MKDDEDLHNVVDEPTVRWNSKESIVCGACLPADKAQRIAAMQAASECVIMVGDGANDTAALAIADIGVAIGLNDLASTASDVVIGSGAAPLHKILSLLAVARRTVSVAQIGVRAGMSASCVQMLFAAAGALSPGRAPLCALTAVNICSACALADVVLA
eukprot:m.535737 g.535737  ORF g.535737 m.535737 type:complete len:159 (+) comp22066_c0_seq21:365-841(+)